MKLNLFALDQEAELFVAGRTVFLAGEPGSLMFAVTAGAVDIVIDGKTLERVGPGGVFGEMALIEELPRSASAIVAEEARLVAIDRKRFMFMVQQNPFFVLHVMGVMAERLRRMGERVSSA